MTPEQALIKVLGFGSKVFVEKAIAGGWSVKHTKVLDIHENGMLYLKDDEEYEITVAEILLDPTSWQAAGKVEGWYKGIAPEHEHLYWGAHLHCFIAARCEEA